jgi:hypothetical protein
MHCGTAKASQTGSSPAVALSLTYDSDMARGWESKSVEEQQSSAELTASGAILDAQKRSGVERAKRERQKQELELQREQILSSRTSSPVRRAALEAALADIESRIALLV